jgi:aminoglycoside phosphotransferase (APT) family kinase protein
MDEYIKEAIKELGYKPIHISMLTGGSFNKVFKITTIDEQQLVMRVFRGKRIPEEGKLEWISEELEKIHVPFARVIYLTRDSKYFKNGFMLQEYVEGDTVQNLVDSKISYKQFYSKLGCIVKKVHDININHYGSIKNGVGEYEVLTDYLAYYLDEYSQRVVSIPEDIGFDFKHIRCFFLREVKELAILPPVLNHGDLSPNNVMLSQSDHQLYIIDWDDAMSHVWLYDFAMMTYWMGFRHADVHEREEYISIFLDRYAPDLDYHRVRHYEQVFHLLQNINLLGYYYYDAKDTNAFKDTVEVFYRLRGTLL